MKIIPLSQGKFAIVDDEDYQRLSQFKWHAAKDNNHIWYALRQDDKKRTIRMHRFILGLEWGDKRQVDHKNHNCLDNQKNNLRICTHAQNMQNRNPIRNCSSVFKGVHWSKNGHKWRASIKMNRKWKHLGYFASEEKAALAYDEAAKKYFGDFAWLNSCHNICEKTMRRDLRVQTG